MTAALAAVLIIPHHVVCLTYHDIVPDGMRGKLWFDTTESEFKAQIAAMKRAGVHFISVDQLYGRLTGAQRLPLRPVCLTFADNYAGFWLRAYPVLKASHIPAAMFVHTGYIGSPIGRPKMTWPQLLQLDREGLVEVASQTVSHPLDLRKLAYAKLLAEFKDSKADLERHLGHPVRDLAYPNGKFNATCERAARATGYRMAFSEVTEPADQSKTLFEVNRYVSTKWQAALSRL
jgi:peptidoglycan/xylan/chitin deacetylase (PgdA/CDA1 family)